MIPLGLCLALLAAQPVQDPRGGIQLEPPPSSETGNRPVSLSVATFSTSIFSGEELVPLGPRFAMDAFRIVPGLEAQRISATESAYSLRGYNDDSSASQGVLLVLDGRQRNNEFFGSVLWESLEFTLDDLHRAEIIRGPVSFLHGPNAMHGFIDLETRSPLSYTRDPRKAEEAQVLIHGFAGSYGSNVESATYVRREGRTALKVRAAHDDLDEFQPRHQNGKDKAFFEARLEGEIGGPGHAFDLAAGAARQKFSTLIPPFSIVRQAEFRNEAEEVFARGEYRVDTFRLRASATRFTADAVPDGVYVPFTVTLDTADTDLQHSWPGFLLERNTLTAGAGYRYSTFETDDGDVADGRHYIQLRSAFAEDEIVLGDFRATGGLRVDDHAVAGTTWSPRLALVWTIDPLEPWDPLDPKGPRDPTGHTLRFSYGAGFRNPSLRELWFDMTVQGEPVPGFFIPVRITGNEDLEAEKMRSLELGYWGRPTPQMQIEAAAYFNLVDRLVSFVQADPATWANPFVPEAGPQNTGKEEAYGAELQVQYQLLHELFSFANYSYGIRRDRDTERRNPGAPKHKASAGLRYADRDPRATGFGGMLWVSAFDDVAFVDPGTGAVFGEADEYALLNGQVYYRFKLGTPEGKAFVQAFNLLDHDHREHPQGDEYGLLLMGGFDLAW